jgi:diaminopimelate decarboxylase
MFNVESPQELVQIHEVAKAEGKKAPVALRVNPNINPKTHPYISTGLKKNKFGIAIDQAVEEYRLAKRLDHLDIVGVHCHIGSQLTEVQPFVDALKKVLKLVTQLKKEGIPIQYLDMGGGLGITYQGETPPKPKELAKAILPLLKGEPYTLILEPGRVLVGNAGILVTKVLYLKESPNKRFAIVDAAMNDLLRPTLYEAYHEILPVVKTRMKPITVDVVGPICETGDFLAKNRKINAYRPGDLLAVMSAGAYGFTMSSNYNARPRVAEVLVNGEQFHVIRQRETVEDLIRGEVIPDFLK